MFIIVYFIVSRKNYITLILLLVSENFYDDNSYETTVLSPDGDNITFMEVDLHTHETDCFGLQGPDPVTIGISRLPNSLLKCKLFRFLYFILSC